MQKRPESITKSDPPGKSTPIGILICFLLLFLLLQIGIYRQSFQIKPSFDDFSAPLAEIHRGDNEGPAQFFISSLQKDYRPLQSLLMWSVGKGFEESVILRIHILHFLSFLIYVFVLVLWIRLFRFGTFAVFLATGIMFLHPVHVGLLASIDGFGRMIGAAWVWLGLYFVLCYLNRSTYLASGLSLICLILGIGFVEYAIQLIPLVCVALLFYLKHPKSRQAAIILSPMISVLVFYVISRHFLIDGTVSGVSYIALNPLTWVLNIILLGSGTLFLGNTVWVSVNQGPFAYLWVAVNVILTASIILWGLYKTSDYYAMKGLKKRNSNKLIEFPYRDNDIMFLGSVFFASCIPVVFMKDITEFYACGMIMPFALLIGKSSYGLIKASPQWKKIIALYILFQFSLAIYSANSKVHDLKDVGDRAEAQIDSILKYVPVDVRNLRIGMVFATDNYIPEPTYSSFRKDDAHLINITYGHFALDWYRPGHGHDLDHLVVAKDISEVEMSEYDLMLLWDYSRKEFTPVYKSESISPR